jgi:hypothetical protein
LYHRPHSDRKTIVDKAKKGALVNKINTLNVAQLNRTNEYLSNAKALHSMRKNVLRQGEI